ncbi:glutamine synthetase family protein [Micromonospora sp. WMMD1155]|uniref:glutamine synthetase family protein n=1 Tax=Micromonospora sp. WMMD1155 TaxID=3016094 RepID=UPI00249C64BB|nr:glutamine synthetase family protein [Micromonospora sp. WMMD1155]WFE54843.1 glutamine synthetase family protein [Micromonospora sp. WMMD1155]
MSASKIIDYGGAARYAAFSTGSVDFIEEHGLFSEAQQEAADKLLSLLDSIDLIRVVFGDPHGLVRSKTLTPAAFRTVMRNGMDMSPGPFVFDTGHAVAIDFFADGGGIGLPELTGAGDFVVVPDARTFRILQRGETRVGWVIGDEYLRSGKPHPLSSRAVLRRLTDRLADSGLDFVVGLEVEWYLTRYTSRDVDSVGGFGVQGSAPTVEAVNPGYQFNSDAYLDDLLPVIGPLARALEQAGLPLRTIEHESGPGQLEFTFSPMSGLAAADAILLLRGMTKQICADLGYHASFMALPALDGFDASGWHLHQSLFDVNAGGNIFAANEPDRLLSPLGEHYLAGLLAHAPAATALAVPTINGYRRLDDAFSLSPDRTSWAPENRGALIRVLGSAGAASTHLENRVGEPSANPYLYLAAQLAAGLDGIDRKLDPGEATQNPHDPMAGRLPTSLADALAALEADPLYHTVLGEHLLTAFLALKRSEIQRYGEWVANHEPVASNQATEWEQREYFAHF